MSSRSHSYWEHGVVLLLAFGLALWYARPQAIYSLYFLYQLGRFLAPGIVPDLGAPG